MVRLLAFPDLASEKGIPFTRQHVWRLVKDGRFPPPVKLGTSTNRWVEHEVDEWLRRQIEARDAAEPADVTH